MAADDVYRKTARGLSEIKDRGLKLSPRLRTMLILVDGIQTEAQLMEGAAGVGAPTDFLAQLMSLGLIEREASGAPAEESAPAEPVPRPAPGSAGPKSSLTRFQEAKNFMNATIVQALGANSLMFAMKLERANSMEELSALVDAFRAALASAKGDDYARSMTKRLKGMM
jgi:hypothetical protein